MTRLLALNLRWWALPTALWLAVLTVLSLTPLPFMPLAGAPLGDKIDHAAVYAVLALPVALARPHGWGLVLLGFAAWSGAIELAQPYVNRFGEWADFAANVLGLGAGVLIAALLRRIGARAGD